MTTKAYDVPQGTPAVAPSRMLTPPWQNYFAGLADVSRRVADNVEPLSPSATLADVIAKQTELIAALKAAGLMREE